MAAPTGRAASADTPMEDTSSPVSGAFDALGAKTIHVLDGTSLDSAVGGVPLELDVSVSHHPHAVDRVEADAVNSSLPVDDAHRTGTGTVDSDQSEAPTAPENQVEASDAEVGLDAVEMPDSQINHQELYAWAVRIFARGCDEQVALGGPVRLEAASVGLCCLVKTVVAAVFKDCAADICRSPERLDLRLSKEEAQGHIIGNLVVGEILAGEARSIGKRVDYYAAAEAKAVERASKQAKEKRRTARAAADDEVREKALEKVEMDMAADHEQRLRAPVTEKLQLPARNTVVVESKPKPVTALAAEAKAVDKLARLRAATSRAEAAVLPAEVAAVAAKRRVKRAGDAMDALVALRRESACGRNIDELLKDEVWQARLEECRELDQKWEELHARLTKLMRDKKAANEAVEVAREAAEEARAAVAEEERARSAARAAAAARAELDERLASLKRKREEDEMLSEERMAEARTRLHDSTVAIARAHVCEPLYWESPDETRARVFFHAAHIWGNKVVVEKPRVFSLVGASAADVHDMSLQVSQQVTSIEERVALNRVAACEYGCVKRCECNW